MKKAFFWLVLFLTTCSTFAQSNYLITVKADTLYGEIRILTYDVQDRVQINTDGKKETFTALQILEVNMKGDKYKPMKLYNSIRMMKVIKDGFLSLYGFRAENQSAYDGRMLVRKDGSSMEVPNISFKKTMQAYVENCPVLAEKIKSGDYSKKDIEKIVDEYNACVIAANPVPAIVPATDDQTTQLKNEKINAVNNLVEKIKPMEFGTRNDALDILKDIQSKIDRGENVSNYQIEALKSFLTEQQSLQEDLEKLINLLKGN